MTVKRRKRFIIQITIFVLAILLIFSTYFRKDTQEGFKFFTKKEIVDDKENEINQDEPKVNEKSNFFENVEYNGIDLNGNRYIVKSEFAEFESDFPELIKMTNMTAIFYFSDGSSIKIIGKYGSYNNKTFDMKFREEIFAEYGVNFLYADNVNYFNDRSYLEVFGNVKIENSDGDILSDRIELDLKSKKLKFSMLNDKTIKAKIKWEKALG